ncbi:MAG: Asp-tRNA(Asn)/Glu-tRNA(Gln) amidotransferase subunit GatC [Clostridia bacterium]|nr:Asp-tRNA(Asn)/Glu-tRNA(Gln) amidotransferase subunit GatC [Clostridia bacterium]
MNTDMIKRLAELSKISFTDEEMDKLASDMNDIIAVMDKVCDFNTATPMDTSTSVNYTDLRADIHKPSCPTEEIIKNAKKVAGNIFTVPKVV